MVAKPVSPDAAAERVARAWLALADAGQVEQSWAVSSLLFRGTLTATSWSLEYSAVRGCLGAVRTRVLRGVRATRRMVGAPEAEYRVFRFRTTFEGQGGELDERVTTTREADGRWRVAGYYVPAPWAPRSPPLASGCR